MVAYASLSPPPLSLSLIGRLQSVRSSRRERHVDAPCLRQRALATHAHCGAFLKQNNMEPSMHGFIQSTQAPTQTECLGLFLNLFRLVFFNI